MSETTMEKARQVVHRLSEWYFAEGGDNDPDSPIDREDLDALHDLVRTPRGEEEASGLAECIITCMGCGQDFDANDDAQARYHEAACEVVDHEPARVEIARRLRGAAVVRRELEAPGAGEDVRERVAREVFALDADWRRKYWDEFRRDCPRQAQAYYDTADRILGLFRTPRGEGEAWRAFLDAVDEVETAAASLWADPEGPTAEDMERLDRARQRVIECGRALAARRSEANGKEADALDLIRWAEARAVALEPVAGNIMPTGTYACYVGDDDDPYMGPGILGAIRAARRGGATWTWSKWRWGMTPQELLALCAESERDGVDYIVLKVATRREPGNRMRILPGVMAEVLDTGRGYAVVRAPARKVREVVERALTTHPTDRSEGDGE